MLLKLNLIQYVSIEVFIINSVDNIYLIMFLVREWTQVNLKQLIRYKISFLTNITKASDENLVKKPKLASYLLFISTAKDYKYSRRR